MSKQERRGWLDVVERWHSYRMIDAFLYYKDILDHKKSLDSMHPLERNIIGNIMAVIAFVYSQVNWYDHLETSFYKQAAIRLWVSNQTLDFPKDSKEYELNMQIPFKEIRRSDPFSGILIRVSKRTALKMMDYFETPEFATLLISLRGLPLPKKEKGRAAKSNA